MKRFLLIALPLFLVLLNSCADGVVLFSLEDDKQMGAETDAQIEADPATYPILNRSSNAQAYAYLEQMKNDILASGEVKYANEFVWELNIIDDDATLNAFCTPGGYIYIYTGLINYLDNASSLAGVMGHEMGHADGRHGSKQMQKQYGIATLLQILTGGDPGALAQMAASLLALKFSRSDETDADERSVRYLCPTDFEADGAAEFFQLMIDAGTQQPPQILSTHPNHENRVADIEATAAAMSCDVQEQDPTINGLNYAGFKALLQ